MPSNIDIVEIFPPIGIARLGDAAIDSEYFFAPEVPGQTGYPVGSNGNPITAFRLPNGQIKQQAVKFRAYGFDKDGICIKELTKADGYKLTWTVNVANTKAAALQFRGRFRDETTELRNPDVLPEDREKLKITPSQTDINSTETTVKKLEGRFLEKTTVLLGSISIEQQSGRLIFRGGNGYAGYVDDNGVSTQPDILSEFDNLNWYDDICDGWVDVRVEKDGWSQTAAHKATVISSPPKFAWGINDTTTLYDVMEDIYQKAGHTGIPTDTQFYRDIWPVFLRSCAMAWVNSKASDGHGPNGTGNFLPSEARLSTPPAGAGANDPNHGLRQNIFNKLREPGNPQQANVKYMPRLSGDDGDAVEAGDTDPQAYKRPFLRYGSVTKLQYDRFKSWADGHFVTGSAGVGTLPDDVRSHPELLTRAALEQTTGTQMYPGIEVYWIAKEALVYDTGANSINPPFRFNYAGRDGTPALQPGDLTARLSLPWQSNFSLCNLHWWPSARPDDVITVDSDEVRTPWVRGLRVTPNDLSSFPGSTDMVKYWSRLGFVVKDRTPPTSFKWTESERQLIPPS